MMIIFVWFIGIQILGPDEQFFDQSGHSIIYNGTFTWKKSDGTKQNISVPGRYKVPAKQTMIITTTLPDDYNENVIAIRTQKAKENLDFLTGLPSRNKGEQAIAQLMKHHSGCLVFMDMDNLKTINDIYGHKAGDRVLKLLGNLLLEYSSECLACRLGGDEFLLFMPDADQNSITDVITAIFKKFNTRKEQDPELHAASISAGLYMCNIGDSFDECYTKADKALYFVKQNGKSDFSFHEK